MQHAHTPKWSTPLQRLARSYARAARKVLGDNLTSVVLYGSVARGEAHAESDIDLLIICKQLPHGIFERNQLLDPVREQLQSQWRRLWARGYRGDFSEILKTEAEAQHVTPPYLDMTEDAILLVDRGEFFAQVLERVRARLKELGAQRKQLGTVRYWDLKPNFRPGEVIEI
jgi:predicted nucleotidyltransferase